MTKILKNTILIILVISTYLFAKTDVIILSDNVGTEIDVHENRFYRIFPEEKDLISAQILKIDRDQYRLMIVKEIAGERKRVRRYLTRNELDDLKMHVDEQPEFTKSQKIAMYEGMDFLRAEKILNEIPKPQYVVIGHSDDRKLNGTLFKFEERLIYIQTATAIERVSLDKLHRLSYRPVISDLDHLRPYTYFFTGITGLLIARIYNSQRPSTYNEYGIPRNDLDAYRQILGTVLGLIFSSEVFDAISTLLTPTETIILSEAEYDKENY